MTKEEIWAQIQKLLIQLETQPSLEQQLRSMVGEYLAMSLAETHGVISLDILRRADQLYDVPGMPTLIAESLGLSVHALRQELGQQHQITCERCSQSFVVLAARVRGGYSCSLPKICPECARRERRESYERQGKEEEALRANRLYRLRVDAQIAVADDPLSIAAFRDHLIEYATFWLGDRSDEKQLLWYPCLRLTFQTAMGACMMCGDTPPLYLFVAQEEAISNHPGFENLVRRLGYEEEMSKSRGMEITPWPPLTRCWQVLWRIWPAYYFSNMSPLPLLKSPILILCKNCAGLAGDTHIELPIPDQQPREAHHTASKPQGFEE